MHLTRKRNETPCKKKSSSCNTLDHDLLKLINVSSLIMHFSTRTFEVVCCIANHPVALHSKTHAHKTKVACVQYISQIHQKLKNVKFAREYPITFTMQQINSCSNIRTSSKSRIEKWSNSFYVFAATVFIGKSFTIFTLSHITLQVASLSNNIRYTRTTPSFYRFSGITKCRVK